LRLGDIQFGIAVRIDNLKDEGACWRRIVVNLRKEGKKIGVFLGNQSDEVWIPLVYREGHLNEVCEALYRILIDSFRENTQLFVEGNERFGTIGFSIMNRLRPAESVIVIETAAKALSRSVSDRCDEAIELPHQVADPR
jgi:uncharacterized protein (DUF58 family)